MNASSFTRKFLSTIKSSLLLLVILFLVFSSSSVSAQTENGPAPVIPVDESPAVETEADATTAQQATIDGETRKDLEKQLEKYCGANPATWFTGCIVEAFFGISARILLIAGWVFDGFLWFSLDNTIFLSQGFISEIWTDIRDFGNAAFILGLIYLSYRLILKGSGDAVVKRMIVKLILIALLINFSLFITRVVIDAGNITALTFYNALDIREDSERAAKIVNGVGERVPKKSVAGAIIQKFNPSRVVSTEVFQTINDRTGDVPLVPGQAGVVGTALNAADRGAIYGAITLLMFGFIIMNIMAAWLLVKGGVFFVSRALWLIVLSVVSPLAFVAYFFPSGEKWFKSWFTTLVDKCFCLPVYFFFIWILLIFLESSSVIFQSTVGEGESGWRLVLVGVSIQFILVYALLNAATKASKKMCDGATINGKAVSIGDSVFKGAKKIGATAIPGLAARRVIGGAAFSAVSGNNTLGRYVNKKAAEGSTVALAARTGLKNISNVKFGQKEGFRDKLDIQAKKRLSSAGEIENLSREQLGKEIRGKRLRDIREQYPEINEKEAILRYEKSNDFLKDKEIAKKAAEARGNNYLAGQARADGEAFVDGDGNDVKNPATGEKLVEVPEKTGVFKRAFDSAVNGFVPAADEAYERRTDQINIGKEEKAIAERKKEEQASRAAEGARRKTEIDREQNKVSAEVANKIVKGEEFSKDFKDELGELKNEIISAFADNFKNNDPSASLSELTDAQKKEYENLTKELKTQLEKVIANSQEKTNELTNRIQADDERVKALREVQTTANKNQDLIQELLNEILAGNENIVVTQERSDALKARGITIEPGTVTFTPEQRAQISDSISISNQENENRKLELSAALESRKELQKELKVTKDNLKKDIKSSLSEVTNAAKERISSKIRSGQSQLIVEGNKRDRRADAAQDTRSRADGPGFGFGTDNQDTDLG